MGVCLSARIKAESPSHTGKSRPLSLCGAGLKNHCVIRLQSLGYMSLLIDCMIFFSHFFLQWFCGLYISSIVWLDMELIFYPF